MHTTHGWTTWDAATITTWEHLPSGIRCHLVLENAQGDPITPTDWSTLEDHLPTVDGHSLSHLVVHADGAEVEVECAAEGDVTACRIWHVAGDGVTARWQVDGLPGDWQALARGQDMLIAPKSQPLPKDVPNFLRQLRETTRHDAPQGTGALAAPLEAMETALAANTFVLPETEQIVTLSRHRTEETGAWCLPNWESFLTALAIAYTDPELAKANVRTALQRLATDSLLSQGATPEGTRPYLSNPPVAAFAVWKIFQLTQDTALLEEAFPILLRWHDWWLGARDANGNSLLSWALPLESGMPGHPLYDNISVDDRSGIMKLDDVGLTSLFALDAFALMRMALQLSQMEIAVRLECDMSTIAEHMNLRLWDYTNRIYRSRQWDGRYADTQSATTLLSLIGRVPTPEMVAAMVREHLALEFNTPHLVPTVGAGDDAYGDQQPWRGRVSALLNLLICEGLRQYGQDDWAERIVLDGLAMARRSWQDGRALYDSYHAITGEGGDIAQDPLAPAGTLFGALGIGLLVDMEPWDGMRLGNLCGVEMSASGIPLHGDTLDITSGAGGLTVFKNGRPWLETDTPVIIRNFQQMDHEVVMSLKTATETTVLLRLHGLEPGAMVSIKVNGQGKMALVDEDGAAHCPVSIIPPKSEAGPWGAAA